MYQQQPPVYAPQHQPVYQQSTQHTARYSQTPNQGRQVEISVTQQVSQQPPQQFAAPPTASYPQQQLQYGQNQVGVPPPVQYAQNPPPPHP